MLALLVLAPALLPSVAHRPQLAGGRRVARHPQLQLLASSASPKEEITPTAGLSVWPTPPLPLTSLPSNDSPAECTATV